MRRRARGFRYDGPAINHGRIPVRDLAPALLALGDLFVDASVLTQPKRKPVALSIEATGGRSFLVHLVLEADAAWDAVEDLFTSDGVTALANLFTLVLGGAGLFEIIRKIRNRRIVAEEALTTGLIRLTLDDGESIEVPAEVVAFYRHQPIRARTQDVVAPLTKPGIERIEFRPDSAVEVAITTSDVPAFAVPDAEEIPLGDHEVDTIAAIASVAFTEGNKWRLTTASTRSTRESRTRRSWSA